MWGMNDQDLSLYAEQTFWELWYIYIYFKTCLMFNCFPAYVNDNEDAKSTPGKAVVR